ncbi:MAG: hypothetical protein HPY81_08575 [Firmicutes bacterium]|nr:hypothetical protein [Bacillota bacterium]
MRLVPKSELEARIARLQKQMQANNLEAGLIIQILLTHNYPTCLSRNKAL